MAGETTISGLNKASGIQENDIIPVVSLGDRATEQVSLNTLRNSIYFQNAFSDHTAALGATNKGDMYFIYTDTTETYVKGWVNQGGGTYAAMIGLNGDVIFPAGNIFLSLRAIVIGIDSFQSLSSLTPAYEGQRVLMLSYLGSNYNYGMAENGGGYFIAHKGTREGFKGYIISAGDGWYWKSEKAVENLTVNDFGAIPDGKTDCAQAIYDFAYCFYTLGRPSTPINFTSGNYLLTNVDLSEFDTGSYSKIQLRGATNYNHGRNYQTNLLLRGQKDGPAITLKHNIPEVSNFYVHGGANVDKVVRSFIYNPKPIQYLRYNNLYIEQIRGKCIYAVNTIDSKIDQLYTQFTYDSIIFNIPDETGTWDITTALEISNFGFLDHLGGETQPAIYAPFCYYSILRNGWFNGVTYPANLIYGYWKFETISLEGVTHPIYAKNCNIISIGPNYKSIGVSFTLGDDPSLLIDFVPTIEPYMKQRSFIGNTRMNPQGTEIAGDLCVDVVASRNRADSDTPNADPNNSGGIGGWWYVGTVHLTGYYQSAEIEILGANGYNAVTSTDPRPGYSTFGSGVCKIRIQNLNALSLTPVSWYNEGSSAVDKVKWKYNTGADSIAIYIHVGSYTKGIASFLRSSGPTSDPLNGNATTFDRAMTKVTDTSITDALSSAPSSFLFSNNKYGLGMDLDQGILSITTDSGQVTTTSAGVTIPVNLNGVTYRLTLSK